MSLVQKLKIILQVCFISGLLLLNAAVYQKYNYFSSAQHLAFIPKTSVLTITLNTNKLTGKLLYNFLYKNEKMLDLFEEVEIPEEERGQFLNNGLDLTNQLTFFLTNNSKAHNFKYAGILADINSIELAQKQLIQKGFKQQKKDGYLIFKKDENQYAVLNSEIVALIHFKDEKYPEIEKLNLLEHFIDGKEKGNLDKKINPFLENGNDVVIYGLPENISYENVWMNYFVAYGNFVDDNFEFSVDFNFKKDITSYFPENKINTKYNFEDLEGYLYFKSTVHVTNASLLIDKFSPVKFNDSIEQIFRPVLHNQLAKGVEFYGFNLTKAELKVSDSANMNMKMISKDFFLPGFNFRLNCSNPAKIDTLLHALQKQNKIDAKDNHWYLWEKDQYYKVFFGVKDDWLNITTKLDGADQMPETGYSNVLYFNTDNFNSKLPNEVFRFAADEKKYFDSFILYSTGVEKTVLHTKGKVVLKKGENSILESINILMRLPEDIEAAKSLLSGL
jgi:hypothetical protein